MKILIAVLGLAVCALGLPARADNTVIICQVVPGTSNCIPVSAAAPLFTTPGSGTAPTPTVPPKITSYGTLAVSTTSINLSTLTVGPNAPAWTSTLPSGYVTVRNSVNSTAVLYFCPLAGTCTAAVGEPIAIGETIVRNITGSVSPTVICGTATACTAIAEE